MNDEVFYVKVNNVIVAQFNNYSSAFDFLWDTYPDFKAIFNNTFEEIIKKHRLPDVKGFGVSFVGVNKECNLYQIYPDKKGKFISFRRMEKYPSYAGYTQFAPNTK